MKKTILILSLIVYSCSNINFVYDNNEDYTNPLYEKTIVSTSGKNFAFLKSYVSSVFGKPKSNKFILLVNVEEKKIKRSVEKNQATSNLDYELRFTYSLVLDEEGCEVYKKVILSSFSIIPKSAGYNYGTDASLEKKYELSIRDNINQFVSFLSSVNVNKCQ